MPTFLSDPWIDEANAALQAHPDLPEATREVALVVQHHVVDGPEGDRSYYVWFDHGTSNVVAGSTPDADVSFSCDWDTAVAIATGAESAQSAFMAGRLRLGGDARALLAHGPALAGLDDALGALRERTSFDR